MNIETYSRINPSVTANVRRGNTAEEGYSANASINSTVPTF